MKKIIQQEHRPFSYIDFLCFEVDGKVYTPKHGTIRNKFSKFLKQKIIELCNKSRLAFYTLPGFRFGKDRLMTVYRTEDRNTTDSFLTNHPIYKVLVTAYFGKQALHNLHFVLKIQGLYSLLSTNQLLNTAIHSKNKAIRLKTYFFEKCTIIINIYTTDTVKVTVGCSENPINLDYNGILRFTSILTRIEERLQHDISSYNKSHTLTLPSFKEWKIVLWHIGRDSLTEYGGQTFHCKWEMAEKMAIRIYTKNLHNNTTIRAEMQFNPEISVKELLMRIILNQPTNRQ